MNWDQIQQMVELAGYKFSSQFDYAVHGANAGSFCPTLKAPCAVEQDSIGLVTDTTTCPWQDEDCPEDDGNHPEWDLVITEKGYVCPDPLA